MDRNFLDAYYKMEREHWWFQVREGIILDQIKTVVYENNPLHILNVGAATGRSSEILESFGSVQSIEYDEPSYRFCHENLKMKIDHGSITELPYADASFDVVCAFDVVEHVEDHAAAIANLIRVCKPGGKVFIIVAQQVFACFIMIVVQAFFTNGNKFTFIGSGAAAFSKPLHGRIP